MNTTVTVSAETYNTVAALAKKMSKSVDQLVEDSIQMFVIVSTKQGEKPQDDIAINEKIDKSNLKPLPAALKQLKGMVPVADYPDDERYAYIMSKCR